MSNGFQFRTGDGGITTISDASVHPDYYVGKATFPFSRTAQSVVLPNPGNAFTQLSYLISTNYLGHAYPAAGPRTSGINYNVAVSYAPIITLTPDAASNTITVAMDAINTTDVPGPGNVYGLKWTVIVLGKI